jgi:CRP-like cAMP-binding protein
LTSIAGVVTPLYAARRGPGAYSLLDLDPELGGLLDAARFAHARATLQVHVHAHPSGPWKPHAVTPAKHLGLLIVDGVIAADTVLDDVVSTELLGAGDILRPWPLDTSERLLPDEARWTVLADCRVAVLDHRIGRFPEIYPPLLERMDRRARRLATARAITELKCVDRRLIAMLWHLAERWGRVTADGILIPLNISHRLLGQLVGARRPTVSTALGKLARAGAAQRLPDGAWMLHGESPRALHVADESLGLALTDARPPGLRQPSFLAPSMPGRANLMP